MWKNRPVQFKFDVFRSSSTQIRVEVDTIGHLGHQRLSKTNGPTPIVILEHRGESEAARIRCIVVGSVVVYGPVHELKVAVGAIVIKIEEVGQAEFAEAEFQPAFRKLGEERERRPINQDSFVPQGDDLVPHEARYVRCLAEGRISNHIQIGKAGDTKRCANSVATCFLNITDQFRCSGESDASEQSQYT